MSYIIEHSGVLGMRWGIRRYQNEDGTLTEAGKRRYYSHNGELSKAGTKRLADAHSNASKAIGIVSKRNGKTTIETSSSAGEILSVAADKAAKMVKRLEYLDGAVSDGTNKLSVKKRYAMSRDADLLRLEYNRTIKNVTDAILESHKQTRLRDFQNGELTVYENQVELLLAVIGKQRASMANKLGL